MKYSVSIFAICLLGVIVAVQPGIADEITATFTFGKIEMLKAGEREWSFLEKGTVLAETDLIRMPPVSLIRLKDAQGTFLPALSGGREVTVRALIREGLQRRSATKGRRLEEHLEGSPAIDVLPLGDKPRRDLPAKLQSRVDSPQQVTPVELEALRRQLDSLPATIVPDIPQLPSRGSSIVPPYPSPNLHRAQRLYAALNDIEAKHSHLPNRSLLYAQLLRHGKIDADLVANEAGELRVIFDTGVSLNSTKSMTANHQLVYGKSGADTIWISVSVQPDTHNFTTAWYNGTTPR